MTEQYDHDQAVKDMIAREQQETKVPFFKCPECATLDEMTLVGLDTK